MENECADDSPTRPMRRDQFTRAMEHADWVLARQAVDQHPCGITRGEAESRALTACRGVVLLSSKPTRFGWHVHVSAESAHDCPTTGAVYIVPGAPVVIRWDRQPPFGYAETSRARRRVDEGSSHKDLAIDRAHTMLDAMGWPREGRMLVYVKPPKAPRKTWAVTISQRDAHGALYMRTVHTLGEP